MTDAAVPDRLRVGPHLDGGDVFGGCDRPQFQRGPGGVVDVAHSRVLLEVAGQDLVAVQPNRLRAAGTAGHPAVGLDGVGRCGDAGRDRLRSHPSQHRGVAEVGVAGGVTGLHRPVQRGRQLAGGYVDRGERSGSLQSHGARRCRGRTECGPVPVDVLTGCHPQRRTRARPHLVTHHHCPDHLLPGQIRHRGPDRTERGHTGPAVRSRVPFAGLVPAGPHGQRHGRTERSGVASVGRRGKGVRGQPMAVEPCSHRLRAATGDRTAERVQHQPSSPGLDLCRKFDGRIHQCCKQFRQTVAQHQRGPGM